MTPHEKRPCHLTVRLAEDMRIRNLAHRTIDAYTFHAARFADFIQKPLDCATVEDVRNFQLYLIDNRKLAYSSFNQAVCALRFLYTHTCARRQRVHMRQLRRDKTRSAFVRRSALSDLQWSQALRLCRTSRAIDTRRRDLLPSRVHAAERVVRVSSS